MWTHPILILHVPVWFAQVWRIFNWLLACGLLGAYAMVIATARRPGGMPLAYVLLLLAIAVGLARGMLLQAERWDQPLDIVGAPLFTLSMLLLVASLLKAAHDMRTGKLMPPFRRERGT